MKKYYSVDFDKQREALLNSAIAKPLIDEIISKADAVLTKTYPILTMSEYTYIYETGNRTKFEDKYFERRNDCSYLSIAYWFTEDEKYIKPLIDMVFMICDEFSWCLPAHSNIDDGETVQWVIEEVDLFQAETGRLLTDIACAVGEKLPYYVNQRIEYEIRRRILNAFPNKTYRWEPLCMNWAAVCAGGSLVALLHYGTDEEIKLILPRLYSAIDNYLKGFNDDGCCVEGYGYWNYGFGYFLIFARTIYDYTNGEVNYFKNEKVKNIAKFAQNIRLTKQKNVSFSDGKSDYCVSLGAMCFLKSLYGDEIILPELSVPKTGGNLYSIREFLWFDVNYKADEIREETIFYNDSQWYIKKSKKFSFAAKGGHNDDPHNHNDIGSFMVAVGNDLPLTDLGAGEYFKTSFRPETRYTYLVNCSRGHSVPIINGKYQINGREYLAKNVKAGDDFFSLDIEGAYEKGIINKIHREFKLNKESMILTDTFDYSDKTESVCERFITNTKPVVSSGCVDLGTASVFFDKEKFLVSVSSEVYRTKNCTDATAYKIDFVFADKNERKFEIEIKIKEA